MKDNPPVFSSGLPWSRFPAFVEQENRFEDLRALLTECALPFSVVRISGGKKQAAHFFITPVKPGGSLPTTVLIAHYDCAEGSPGANDNAAGVFILIETALKLIEAKTPDWLIIFTDKEELETGESLRRQGSFSLANFFRTEYAALSTRNSGSRFFIFDACGCGDTLIISTMADYLLKKEKGAGRISVQKNLAVLRYYALEKAKKTMRRFLLLPTPFSDDAGFLRAGLAAQLITVLPSAEASEFASLARVEPLYIDALVNGSLKKNRDQSRFPETWRVMNTPADTLRRLTPKHFAATIRFAAALAALNI